MDLERSTLERKDRAELATIAEALGQKAPSRAKKADIVALILELVSDSAAPAPVDAATAVIAADAERPADAELPTAPEGSADVSNPLVESIAEAAEPNHRSNGGGRPPRAPRPPRDSTPAQTDLSDAEPAVARTSPASPDADVATSDTDESPDPLDANFESEGEGGARRRRRRRGRDRDRPEGEGPSFEGEAMLVEGLLDLREDGYGFLRVNGFLPSRDDVYVSVKQCRQLGLRKGDHLTGSARPAGLKEKNPAMVRIDLVNGLDPDAAAARPNFDQLTPLYPDEPLKLEQSKTADMTGRIIDLIAPIGKGQRGLIVSPPKAGKTTIMKTIAKAIEASDPDISLIVLLIDERPEEVTDFKRSLDHGVVVASTFDRPAEEHTAVAELCIEHAKRMVEYGQDVVIILDGITRLARAYNQSAPATGRVMSGGIDAGAIYPPKKFFGAARNVEEGGSLTILATALVETGSAMDNLIFEEFKGTGNMELRLDRRAAERRIYPAIDVEASSTRHEELLIDRAQLQHVWKLRRVVSGVASDGSPTATLELLIDRMRTFPTNKDFLAEIAKAPSA